MESTNITISSGPVDQIGMVSRKTIIKDTRYKDSALTKRQQKSCILRYCEVLSTEHGKLSYFLKLLVILFGFFFNVYL